MSDEEIKAYVFKIENTAVENLPEVLPKPSDYNADIKMSKICDNLSENIDTLRELNSESASHELDGEISILLEKLSFCNGFLKSELTADLTDKKIKHKLVFAKTPAGKPYFLSDLNKVPCEVYDEVKSVLNDVVYGVNMSDKRKVKYYTNIDLPFKVLEFKGYQVRIYTTKLKNNILCVVGIDVKKATYDKKLKENLKFRLSQIREQVHELKIMLNSPQKKEEILSDSENILEEIMGVLNKHSKKDSIQQEVDLQTNVPDEIEELFPEEEVNQYLSEEATVKNVSDFISTFPKKVKRRTRGLGKKTIAKRKITDSLKGFSLEELMEVQNFINKLKLNKELNDSISRVYQGFLDMNDEQKQDFESSIKDFKHDPVGKHK